VKDAIDAGNVEISTVPFIRFRKSLTTTFPQGRFLSVKWENLARAWTVFVVNAAASPEFLLHTSPAYILWLASHSPDVSHYHG
jgi:hypothetical protein